MNMYRCIYTEREVSLGNDFSARAIGDLGQFKERCAADEIYIHEYKEYAKREREREG